MYAIKISKTGRYINYCDKCWYETINEPVYLYSYEQAKEIALQMREHYVYRVELISKDGTIEVVDAFYKNPMKEVKKSISKIRIKL